jgi:AcrR family transcriptional regulator
MAAKREGIATNDANSGRPHPEPQIAPPPWQRLPDRQGRRRREPISREAIVAAAIRLLDREGLAALSMRRLAEELGTGAASLYWHVGSKDGLLDLVFDELIGEEQVPGADPSRWQEQLKDIARAQRRVFADADERFEMLIDIFVDGLARRAAVSSRRDRAAPSAH